MVRAQLLGAVRRVQRVHLERRRVDQEPRTDELLVQVMVAQHVAHVLAQKTLDALAELHHSVDIALLHAPRAIRRIGRSRRERRDLLFDPVVPGHIGDQVPEQREGPHRLDRHRTLERQILQSRHAHQLRHSVHFGRAAAAATRLAVPPDREIRRLLGLDLVHRIEHHHAFAHLGRVVAVVAAGRVAAPDPEGGLAHYFISSMTRCSSGGMGGTGMRVSSMRPSAPFLVTIRTFPKASSFAGKSSRKWAPRLSVRSRAERAMASLTMSMWRRSIAVCQPGLYSRLPVTATLSTRARNASSPSSARAISGPVRTMPT